MKKTNKLCLPLIILSAAVAVIIVYALIAGITQKPSITEAQFPFSICYELEGKSETIEGVYTCRFIGASQSVDPHDRFYEGFVEGEDYVNEYGHYVLKEDKGGQLVLNPNFYPDYLMGDPTYELDEDFAQEPFISYYDSDGMEYTSEIKLAEFAAKITAWDYAEPIENTLVFSHISRLTGDNVWPMELIALLALILCFLLVKKEKELIYSSMDKLSRVINVTQAVTVIPFLSIACPFLDINGSGASLSCQIGYCTPAIAVLCLAASVCLRRKGYSKSGFLIQFGGLAVLALVLVLDVFS